MEIVVLVLGVWLLTALALALVVGRFLRVADRRERAANQAASSALRPPAETAHLAEPAKAQESA